MADGPSTGEYARETEREMTITLLLLLLMMKRNASLIIFHQPSTDIILNSST
jgi:hypothetical protein